MDTDIQHIYDTESFRREAHVLVDKLADHLSSSMEGKGKVYPGLEPAEMLERWRGFDRGEWSFREFTDRIFENSINLHHPNYIGHQVVPPAPLAVLAEFMAAMLNNGMAIYEMGPASSAIEKLVIEQTCSMMGYGEGASGILTSGGSAGNLTALLSARQVQSGLQAWNSGNPGKWAIMVSAQAHYSVERAVKIMGFGEDGLIRIPVREDLSIDPSTLEIVFSDAVGRGLKPFAIVGNACSTATGTYDSLDALADFAESKALWFHVDGAHGAAARLLPEYADLVRGIERADSIVIDFHKMMMTPALTTALIYKNGDHAYNTFAQDADYLLKSTEEGEWYNSANRSLECTKLMMSLRPYVFLKEYGLDGFRSFIRATFGIARTFEEMISADPNFELFMPAQANIVCFRFRGDDATNQRIRAALIREGSFYIVQTSIRGRTWLRTTFMNPFTGPGQCAALLDRLKELAE